MEKKSRPKIIYAITILTGLTITRAQAILILPTFKMFGGTSPDEWLAPWVTDSLLGSPLTSLMISLAPNPIIKGCLYSMCGALNVDPSVGSFLDLETEIFIRK
ncbi:MAG: hypothetical protein WBG42_01065 [Cryomorphaceae bacterium]